MLHVDTIRVKPCKLTADRLTYKVGISIFTEGNCTCAVSCCTPGAGACTAGADDGTDRVDHCTLAASACTFKVDLCTFGAGVCTFVPPPAPSVQASTPDVQPSAASAQSLTTVVLVFTPIAGSFFVLLFIGTQLFTQRLGS